MVKVYIEIGIIVAVAAISATVLVINKNRINMFRNDIVENLKTKFNPKEL